MPKKYFSVHRELFKEYKRIRRIRQEYFAMHRENADRHKTEPPLRIFDQNKK